MLLVTAAEMRELDRLTIEKYGTPGFTLMERAGQGATDVLLQCFPQVRRRRVVVCAGRGNNGGDGFIIARELKRKKVAVELFLLGKREQVRGDAARALASYVRARGKILPCTSESDLQVLQGRLEGAGAVVDAIFGTGLKGEVGGRAADVITLLNASGVPCFAVDIPSGLDSDRGVPLGVATQAEATATFGFAKLGQVMPSAAEYVGDLAVIDIGIAPEAVEEVQPRGRYLDAAAVGRLVPRRSLGAHKGNAGHLLVIAGGLGKTGAAMLCAHAATRGGAGLVTAAVPASQQPVVAGGLLEVMTVALADRDGEIDFDPAALEELLEGKSAVAIGPGIGTGDGARATVTWLLEHAQVPCVIDADGLNCLARAVYRLGRARAPIIVTPHPGEMGRLMQMSPAEVQADRVEVARKLAVAQQCTVVLKGAGTVVATGDGAVAINSSGNPGMASGGMGDVLTGIVGALLAQGLSPRDAADLGVFAHGMGADLAVEERGPIGIVASDVAERLPRVFGRLQAETDAS